MKNLAGREKDSGLNPNSDRKMVLFKKKKKKGRSNRTPCVMSNRNHSFLLLIHPVP